MEKEKFTPEAESSDFENLFQEMKELNDQWLGFMKNDKEVTIDELRVSENNILEQIGEINIPEDKQEAFKEIAAKLAGMLDNDELNEKLYSFLQKPKSSRDLINK
jgi:hypothetical protein